MKSIVEQIKDGPFGILSFVAQQGLDNNDVESVIDALGQQAVTDAPDATKKLFGTKLYNKLVKAYNNLPEDKKTYTTSNETVNKGRIP